MMPRSWLVTPAVVIPSPRICTLRARLFVNWLASATLAAPVERIWFRGMTRSCTVPGIEALEVPVTLTSPAM